MSEEEVIRLKPFALTRKDYFRMLWYLRTRGATWLYVLMLLLGIVYVTAWGNDRVALIIGLLFIAVSLTPGLRLYRFVRLRSNRTLLEERRIEMTASGLSVFAQGGAQSYVPWTYVVHCVDLKRFYLLYLSEVTFLPIDKSSFPDHTSERQFREWLTAVTPR